MHRCPKCNAVMVRTKVGPTSRQSRHHRHSSSIVEAVAKAAIDVSTHSADTLGVSEHYSRPEIHLPPGGEGYPFHRTSPSLTPLPSLSTITIAQGAEHPLNWNLR